jgi:hypothetical protein
MVEVLSAAMSALADANAGDYTLESICGRAGRDGRRFRQMDKRAAPKCASVGNLLRGYAAQGLMLFEGFDLLQDRFDYEFIAEFAIDHDVVERAVVRLL